LLKITYNARLTAKPKLSTLFNGILPNMSHWKHNLAVSSIIQKYESEQDDEEDIPFGITQEIQAELNKLPEELQQDVTLADIKETLEGATTIGELDEALEQLYDWADEHMVWLGI
jgi:hypothetical protein